MTVDAGLYYYSGGALRRLGVGGIPDPDPDPDPPPPDPDPPPLPQPPSAAGWTEAVATRDYAAVEAWYDTRTGYGATGRTLADLTPGSLVSQFDGQVFEGIRGGPIRVAHDGVIYRGCLIDAYGTHGGYFNPTFGSNHVGTLIEQCTYDGGYANVRAAYWAGVQGAVTTRFCDIRGWRSGHSSAGGARLEYCWIHDLSAAGDSHRTGCLIEGAWCRYYRNYVTDGGSGSANIYFDDRLVHNSSLEENILNGSSPNASPSFLINLKDGAQGPNAYNVKILGNYLGHQHQFGQFAGANVPWNTAGNQLAGNRDFASGELVFNA